MNLFRISTPDVVLAKEWIKKLERKGLKRENQVSLDDALIMNWDVTGILVDIEKNVYFLYYGLGDDFKDFCKLVPIVSFTRANKLIKEM